MNTSYHKIINTAAFATQYPSRKGILNFTTAFNTSSTDQSGVTYIGYYINTKCNFIKNECTESAQFVIYPYGVCTFLNSSFIENVGKYLFAILPTIENCYFGENDVEEPVSNDQTLNTDHNEPLDSYISHYSTFYCPGDTIPASNKKYKRAIAHICYAKVSELLVCSAFSLLAVNLNFF
ncbi:hypothetical protein TVAG_326020 [Trichomonas vaginalis G3]|uniref:Uncharacterized protein n=1 Tax=Trichomonas vaginalis (strain ATCC PRA-98 / G3) TaxID=412133 RepID=A2GIM7_TRIV3|nr:hypothetical protein TVAGG3_0736070 [Trichomonas vaginalis G3]EAX82990.1 hypothetical protein TVAG_326020 [Trichomonas vaginalis G3]KAI5511594.1 hypothetical protein TVAGG3_0736070 [Trichomonas vaginalis G3]|eukprot:XP_001295920.1 hypothetical protein [Trichomonas vaginalis G3]